MAMAVLETGWLCNAAGMLYMRQIIDGRENRGQLQLSVGLEVIKRVRGSLKPRPRLVHASAARCIMMNLKPSFTVQNAQKSSDMIRKRNNKKERL